MLNRWSQQLVSAVGVVVLHHASPVFMGPLRGVVSMSEGRGARAQGYN